MKSIFYIIIAAIVGLTAAASCSKSSSSLADDLREAEAAAALGDMAAAQSVANRVISTDNLSNLSAAQLARLSLVYMQIADSCDRENAIAQAADLYRQAFSADPDSALAVYSEAGPEMYPYITMLRTLVGHLDNPYDPEADSLSEMGHDELPQPDSIR